MNKNNIKKKEGVKTTDNSGQFTAMDFFPFCQIFSNFAASCNLPEKVIFSILYKPHVIWCLPGMELL